MNAALELLAIELAADASGLCTVISNSDGVLKLEVRATSTTGTTYCDLATGSRLEGNSGTVWDMSFQRFKYGTNSGTSGSGSGGACETGTTDFASVTNVIDFSGGIAPDCPLFSKDTNITTSSGGVGGAVSTTYNGNLAFDDWYLYDIFTHVLTTRRNVFIVRSGDGGSYYRVRFTEYYNGAGSAGYPTLEAVQIPF